MALGAQLHPWPLAGVAGAQLAVWSMAGHATCCWLKIQGVTIVVDVGCCPMRAVTADHLFVTHGHMDHVSAIATHANLRHLYGVGGATYYVHADMAAHVRDLFRVSEAMCGMELPATVRPFQAHEEIPLGNDLFVTPIPSRHRVTSHAIAVWRTVRKLKPELQGVAGDDIARRKRAGEEVTTQERRLEVLFTGDTTIDLFDEQPVCYTAKCLVVECTYVSSDIPTSLAHERGHIHLADLASRAHLIEAESICLMHFSSRHSPDVVRASVDEMWPSATRSRVHMALDALQASTSEKDESEAHKAA